LRRECRSVPTVPVCSCAHFYAYIAHETAGAACTRHSLHPPFSEGGDKFMQASGVMRRENAKSYLRRMGRAKRNPSPVTLMGIASLHPSYEPAIIASAAKQSIARLAEARLLRFARNDADRPRRTGYPRMCGISRAVGPPKILQPAANRGFGHAHVKGRFSGSN